MKTPTNATSLGLAVAFALAVGACGSSTPAKVSLSPAAPASTTSSTTSTSTAATQSTGASLSSSSSTASSATSASSTAAATSAATTTRTETAPAFVGTNPTSSTAIGHALAAAIALLKARGYVAVDTASYDAGDTLRVLIGRRPGTASERAFFFDQTIYLGTDASTPSEQITLLDENDTEATLAYAIYSPGASQPSSERSVRFALDMGSLSALDPLPSAAERR